MEDIRLKTALRTFAVLIFIVALTLAIFYGIVNGKELVTVTKENVFGPNTTVIEERFNFGLFLIEFLKWIAFGLFGGGVLLGLANRVSEY